MAGGGTVNRTGMLIDTALAALPQMLDQRTGTFVFTVRPSGPAGQSLRYTCITLIGLGAAARAGWRPGLDVHLLVNGVADRSREITNWVSCCGACPIITSGSRRPTRTCSRGCR
jgi:hypothetical protein